MKRFDAVRAVRFIALAVACSLAMPLLTAHAVRQLATRQRGVDPRPENDTVLYAQEATTPFTWEIALPAGTYYISLASGDARYGMGPSRIRLSGDGTNWDTVVNDVETVPMEYYPVIEHPITVSASRSPSRLSMELGGNTALASAINFMIISSSTSTPPSFPIEVNFQPVASACPPTGYAAYACDKMALYGDRGNGYTYGWDSTTGLSARERGINADKRLDTNIYVAGTTETRTWELEIPMGTYYVTLYSGDAQYQYGPNRVKVEGITWIDDVTTVGGEFASVVNRLVTVYDGKLTVQIGDGVAGDATAINYITVNNVRPAVLMPVRMNFQPGYEFTLAPNFVPDSGAIFKDLAGFGWSRSRGTQSVRAGINSDYKLDTFVYVRGDTEDEVDWNYELPGWSDGTYYVYGSGGDPRYASTNQHVYLQKGTAYEDHAVNGVTTAANEFWTFANRAVHLSDTNSNGTIDAKVTIGQAAGQNSWTELNYFIINDTATTAWTFPISIDFHPSTKTACSGYLSDTGGYYDLISRYGWTITGTGSDFNQTNTPADPNSCEKKTIVYPKGTAGTWQIKEIPAGSYDVAMIFGDADFLTTAYTLVFQEGTANQVTLTYAATPANTFWTPTQTVTVGSDGVLSIKLASYNPICSLVISQH